MCFPLKDSSPHVSVFTSAPEAAGNLHQFDTTTNCPNETIDLNSHDFIN